MGSLADQIDALLPQTQCTKCGYEGCHPYADAIAAGEADINQCPPGGAAGIEQLAKLLGRPAPPLNSANGIEQSLRVAVIDESLCIGCTLCLPACPVDAIVGSSRRMHTVIASRCTGCDLCLPPCPMDCISMVAVAPARSWTTDDAQVARAHFHAHRDRQHSTVEPALNTSAVAQKNSVVATAVERARQRRATSATSAGPPQADRGPPRGAGAKRPGANTSSR